MANVGKLMTVLLMTMNKNSFTSILPLFPLWVVKQLNLPRNLQFLAQFETYSSLFIQWVFKQTLSNFRFQFRSEFLFLLLPLLLLTTFSQFLKRFDPKKKKKGFDFKWEAHKRQHGTLPTYSSSNFWKHQMCKLKRATNSLMPLPSSGWALWLLWRVEYMGSFVLLFLAPGP